MGLMSPVSLGTGGARPSPRPEPGALPDYQLLGKNPVFLEHTLGVSGVASCDLQLPDPWAGRTFHPSGSLSSGVLSWTMEQEAAQTQGRGDPSHCALDGGARGTRGPQPQPRVPRCGQTTKAPAAGVHWEAGAPVKGAHSRVPRGLGGRSLAGSRPLALQVQSSASWVPCPSEQSDGSAVNDQGHFGGEGG